MSCRGILSRVVLDFCPPKQMRIIRARYILKARRNEFAALFYADFL